MPNDIANNMADTINQLDEQIKELEAKHWDECRQIAHYDDELKEAKRLLEAAVKIAKTLPCDDNHCGECVHNDNGYVCSEYEYFEWRYADAALKLIGGNENG